MLANTFRRNNVDNMINFMRFKMDVFPSMDYQPLPWLNIRTAKRSRGVKSRWEAVEQTISPLNIRTALDIGSNVGYFSISLAKMGIHVVSIESHPKYFRIFQYAVNKLMLEQKIGILYWQLTPNTTQMLPHVDCTLFLSVWHHIVRYHGFEQGTQVLKDVWNRTNKVLFFETGENEMPKEYNLPSMHPNPQAFLQDYLQTVCQNGQILHLGEHDAFSPDGKWAKRNLFAIVRQAS